MNSRFKELDGLRGIAALGVVLFHYTGSTVRHDPDFPFRLTIGMYGVQLFFVISGFVIYYTLERCASIRDFAFTRFSRLYPTYWVALGLSAIATLIDSGDIWLAGYALNATMLQEFFGVSNVDMVFWSLTVELAFYTRMALFFVLNVLHRVTTICWIWLLASLGWAFTDKAVDVPEAVDTFVILEHVPYFVAGIMFMRVHREGFKLTYTSVILAAATVITIANGLSGAIVALIVFSVVALAVRGNLRFLTHPVLVWLGMISYALYVTHWGVGWHALHALQDLGIPSIASLLIMTAFALALATAITYWVEKPALHWLRQRYSQVRSKSLASEAKP